MSERTMTDDLRARLEADQRIIEEAAEGPWEVLKERVVTEYMDMVTPRLHSAPDAEFIAASRTRWEQANRALLAVLELHSRDAVFTDMCDECSDFGTDDHPPGQHVPYPCPSVKAIQEEMER